MKVVRMTMALMNENLLKYVRMKTLHNKLDYDTPLSSINRHMPLENFKDERFC